MHKLIEYICDELDALERKAEKDGKLSVSEIQYGDMLAHFKKNLLKAEEMDGGEYDGYSRRAMSSYRYDDGFSRGRGRNAKRDSRGRYATSRGYDGYSGGGDMIEELRGMMDEAQDERSRTEIQKFINKMEQMR
jgi:hypothetical protein